eukprot:2536937-Rhodomonas_salina.1
MCIRDSTALRSDLGQLDVRSNRVGAEGGRAVGRLLQRCGRLQRVGLDSNAVGDEGVRGVCEGLRREPVSYTHLRAHETEADL